MNNEFKKQKFQTRHTQYDENGTIKSVTERNFTKKVLRDDDFIKVYLKDISGIIKLNNSVDFRVLLALWEISEYNTNEVILIKSKKAEIAKKLNVKLQTINDSLSRLKKKEIIISKERSVYILNPLYFFKGDEMQRDVIQLNINYVFEDDPSMDVFK